jgi:phage terminase large subunit-like protein
MDTFIKMAEKVPNHQADWCWVNALDFYSEGIYFESGGVTVYPEGFHCSSHSPEVNARVIYSTI